MSKNIIPNYPPLEFSLMLLVLLPLFFLPFTQDFYDMPKWSFLVLIGLSTLVTWTVATLKKQRLMSISLAPLMIGCGALSLASLSSVTFASANKIEALLAPYGPITFLSFTLMLLLLPATIGPMKSAMRWSLYVVASILSLIAIYQFFGMGKIMFPAAAYLTDPLWTPTGASIATLIVIAMVLPLLGEELVTAIKKKHETVIAFTIIMTLVMVSGALVTLWHWVPKISSTMLPLKDSWAIAMEVIKTPKQAILGVGAENFVNAFTAGRPQQLNTTPLWNLRFSMASSFFLHILTTYGILGATATLAFAHGLLRRRKKDALFIGTTIGTLALLFTPPSISVLAIIITLAILSVDETQSESLHLSKNSIRVAAAITAGLITISGLWGLTRVYGTEHVFFRSLQAAQQNNGTETYNLQVKAVQQMPMISRFHMALSQTSLALADSLARALQEETGNPEADTDAVQKDRDLAAQLVQQSIREAKLAVNLNQSNILAWENLARIYQNLTGVAQGADQWSVATFQRAVQLDPTNPALRIELGNAFIRMQNYTEAITQFQASVILKPDYANGYYNLANAYKLNGDETKAVESLEQVLSLLPTDSADYTRIEEELKILKEAPATPREEATEDQSIKSPSQTNPQPLSTPTEAPVMVPPLDVELE